MPEDTAHDVDSRPPQRGTTGNDGDGFLDDPEFGPEAELWRGHPHWKDFVDLLATAGLWTLAAAVIAAIAGRPASTVCFWITIAGWAYAGLRVAHGMLKFGYRLTNQRLFVAVGVFSKTIDQIELVRVDDVRIRKSLLQRLVGLGTVEVISTDASDASAGDGSTVLHGIEHPEQFADLIRHHMRRLRQKSVYVERL